MARETLNPKELFDSTQYGFSQVTLARPGKMVFVSGQVAWDKNGQIVGPDNLEIQTQTAIDNIKIAVEAAGGTLQNVVMLRIYRVDYQPQDGPIINAVLRKNFGSGNPPSSTWVSVKGLANPDFMIEIEAQAVI